MRGHGKTGSKGIHRRRPSIEEQQGQPGQPSIVTNLWHTTIHNLHAAVPPVAHIPTIMEDLTTSTESGTKPTPRTHNIS
eukprot:1013970-Amphidinium_carterae.2